MTEEKNRLLEPEPMREGDFKAVFPYLLKEELRKRQRTPYSLSKKSKIDPDLVDDFIDGKSIPNLEELDRICDVLDVDESIFTGLRGAALENVKICIRQNELREFEEFERRMLKKKVPLCVLETKEQFMTVEECAKHLDTVPVSLSSHLRGERESINGYHVKYLTELNEEERSQL